MKQNIIFSLLASIFLLSACSSPTDPGEKSDSRSSSTDEIKRDTNDSFIVELDSEVSRNNQDCEYDKNSNTLNCGEKKYKTIKIGTQIWMAENLNYGVMAATSLTNKVDQVGNHKFCYNNLDENCDEHGGLYQWHTAMGFPVECSYTELCENMIEEKHHQGVCPNGWHIPKAEEWHELLPFFNPSKVISYQKTNTVDFSTLLESGSNDYGFSLKMSGQIHGGGGSFSLGKNSYFRQIEEVDMEISLLRNFDLSRETISESDASYTKQIGISIRCIKD